MTTLVALATKDALVMGCDSLGTVTKDLVDPFDLVEDFFDPKNEWKLKTDEQGKPILQKFGDIYSKAQMVPFNSMTHVGKLFSLDPLEMGVMATGISSIGQRTIKSLIQEFKIENNNSNLKRSSPNDYKVKIIGEELLEFINRYFQKEYSESQRKPELELMIGGYDATKRVPSIYRVLVNKNEIEETFPEENPFGIAFGGQMQEIQRIVFGTDSINNMKLLVRIGELFNKYREFLQNFLAQKGISEELPSFQKYEDLLSFKDWAFDGLHADWGDFSEQNAIECVNFFVEIMVKSQQFSSKIPTVGGDVHIALITKDGGFKFISREEYLHEGHATPMEGQQ